MSNLIDGLQEANEESRRFLAELEDCARVMGHKGAADDLWLRVSKAITEGLIRQTEAAIASGDVLQMLAAASAHGLDTKET